MDRYNVPQFIDVEAKIIGPITTRQFIIMLIACGLTFIWYKTLNFWAFVIIGLLSMGLGFALAFLKINGQPMHFFIINVIETLKRPNLRIWNKLLSLGEVRAMVKEHQPAQPAAPKTIKHTVSGSHLAQLALVVDTGGAYRGEEAELHLQGFDTRVPTREELRQLWASPKAGLKKV